MRYRVLKSSHLVLHYYASAAPSSLRAQIVIDWDDGQTTHEEIYVDSFTTNRTMVTRYVGVNDGVRPQSYEKKGWVVGATVAGAGSGKRGQLYAVLEIGEAGGFATSQLCRGYMYDTHAIALGEYVEAGPGGGEGFLSWVPAFTADRAGNAAAVDFSLAATNAFRKVYGVAWYYHCSSDVANRILNAPALVNMGGATPTGFTTTGNNALFWNTGANITLDADQEGAHISYSPEAKDGRTVTNDQGVQSIASTAGAPTPWPLRVTEEELAVMRFPAITLGEVLDTHSAYVLIEEWIVL